MTDFAVSITPRFYETDALGHINNAAIAAWFEVARISFLESLEPGDAGTGKNWVLASIKLDFVAETYYGSEVSARIVGARAGNTSLTVDCEMWQNDALTVRGEAVLVHFDVARKQSMRLPEALRRKVLDYGAA